MPDLQASLSVCGGCGHVQALLEPDEACTCCGKRGDWVRHDGAPRQKALMPSGGVL